LADREDCHFVTQFTQGCHKDAATLEELLGFLDQVDPPLLVVGQEVFAERLREITRANVGLAPAIALIRCPGRLARLPSIFPALSERHLLRTISWPYDADHFRRTAVDLQLRSQYRWEILGEIKKSGLSERLANLA
jgi:hypothetical protein